MKKHVFPEGNNFYKANLHCHTTFSDGVLTPEQVKELYKANGYSIVAYTDHDNYCYHGELNDESFLALGGYEVGFDMAGDYGQIQRVCHLNAIARDPINCNPLPYCDKYTTGWGKQKFMCDSYGVDNIQRAINELKARGFIMILNHPVWSNMPMEDVMALDGLMAMEVFNSGSFYYWHHACGNMAYYEYRLKNGKPIGAVMADDNHDGRVTKGGKPAQGCETCKAWTMICAPDLKYASVMKAFDQGHFYASRGPEIKALYFKEDKLILESSPIKAAFLNTKYISTWCVEYHKGELFTHVEFEIGEMKEKVPMVWIKLLDDNDLDAVTNPIFFKDYY